MTAFSTIIPVIYSRQSFKVESDAKQCDRIKVWTKILTKMVWSKWPKLKQNNLHLICQNIGYGPLTSWFANFDIKHWISWDFIFPKFFCMIFGFCFEKSADIFARKFKCYNNNMCATVIFFKTLGHTFNWPLRPHCSASDATLPLRLQSFGGNCKNFIDF